MSEFQINRTMEDYALMIKEFIDEGKSPLQIDIHNHFKNIIPRNKIKHITISKEYIGRFWNIERKVPKGYIYVPIKSDSINTNDEILIIKDGNRWRLKIKHQNVVYVDKRFNTSIECLSYATQQSISDDFDLMFKQDDSSEYELF